MKCISINSNVIIGAALMAALVVVCAKSSSGQPVSGAAATNRMDSAAMKVQISAQETAKTARVQENDEAFTIPEAKASLTIPDQWLKWRSYFALDTAALSRVQSDSGRSSSEWDSAYGPIADAILPFADCLLHIGNDGWGWQGAMWSDVQMRAYLTDVKPDEITKAVTSKGIPIAQTKGQSVKSDSKKDAGWQVDHLGFDLWLRDYHAPTAGVYLYSRPCGARTLVLVFMLSDLEKAKADRDSILKSFRMNL